MKIFHMNCWKVDDETEAQIFKNVIGLKDIDIDLFKKHTKENANELRRGFESENLFSTAIADDGEVYIFEFDKKCECEQEFLDVKWCDTKKKLYIEVAK